MAKGKNEILLSIALEGDAEVKSKLAAVGDASKKSLGGLDKSLGDAKSGFGGLGETAGKLSEALAPLTEAGGLAGLAGLGGFSGIFSRFTAGLLSPAGLVAGITSALLGMAKLGEETQRQKDRLKGLGDEGGFGKLGVQAKALGTDVTDLQPRYEKFLAFQQKLNAENRAVIHPPGFEPGAAEESAAGVRSFNAGQVTTPPSKDAFQTFDRALFEEIRRDVGNSEDAHRLTGQFEDNLYQKGLTADDLRSLQKTAPSAANFVTTAVSERLGQGFANPNELATQIDRGRVRLGATDVINEGARHAPEADKEAAAARGVTEALGSLEAAAKRLAEAFGGDGAGLAKGIDSLAKGVDGAAETVDRQLHAKDYQPGGPKFIGPVRPQDDLSKPPASLGEVISSDKGDLLGRIVGYIRDGASNNGAGTNPFGVITDFLTKALTNPAAISGNAPAPIGPGGLSAEGLAATRIPSPLGDPTVVPDTSPPAAAPQLLPDRSLDGTPIAPIAPAPVTPEQPPQRLGAAEPSQPIADLGPALQDLLRSLVQGITEKANTLAPAPDNKVQGPVDTLGIRGETPSSGTSVADASQSIMAAGDKLAAALDGVTALIGSVQGGGAQATVHAATGGSVRKNMDDGGHVSGPGTSTSDSIPAMLSDKEYVIKASSAQKIGRQNLDWLNSGMPGYADGGAVTRRRLAMVRRLADGGTARDDGTVSRTVANPASLGPGDHEITYDPTTGGAYVDGTLHVPGDPLLDDPVVKQGIAQSKAGMNQKPSKNKYKSDFVGRFGHSDDADTYVRDGGPIGDWRGYAGGGAVGNVPNLRATLARHFSHGGNVSLAPMLHLADGGAAGASAPTLDPGALASSASSLGHFDVDLRTNHGEFKMMASQDVARQMSRAAGDAALAQTGRRPGWYEGR